MELISSLGINSGETDVSPNGGTTVFLAGDVLVPEGLDTPPIDPELRAVIRDADVSVCNLEGPVTADPEPIEKSGPLKHSAANTPALLDQAGFDAVTLANNHAMDYAEQGLRVTIEQCRTNGIHPFGAGNSIQDALEPLHERDGDAPLAIFNLCEREFGEADTDRPGTAWIGHAAVESRIADASAGPGSVIGVVHGGVEYVPLPPPHFRERCRRLIDLGVELVVGHHPHVAQGWEKYGDGLIVYSLGNFYFEQPRRPQTQWGTTIAATFDEHGVSRVELDVIESRPREVSRVEGPSRESRLDHLQRIATITQDDQDFEVHWQAQAVQIFHERYAKWLRTGVGARPRHLLAHPSRILNVTEQWNPDERNDEMLVLLNLVRNDSHRAVIETALEVETGTVPDRRTAEIETRVDELLACTDDRRDERSRLDTLLAGVKRMFGRNSPHTRTEDSPSPSGLRSITQK